jgi:hypothetical protein
MKTLELKDICGYLPYGLMQKHYNDVCSFTIATQSCMGKDVFHEMPIRFGKPILRPMSDLTKEITHKGEKFVPLLALDKLNCFPISDTDKALRYYDKLNEWMFDYRGLISAGLAIDVNTLPENPYEL